MLYLYHVRTTLKAGEKEACYFLLNVVQNMEEALMLLPDLYLLFSFECCDIDKMLEQGDSAVVCALAIFF